MNTIKSIDNNKLKSNFFRKFGVSQGRLTESEELQRFPSEAWQLEFYNASELGLSFIELLAEREYNEENPLWSEPGRKEIMDLCNRTGCETYSLCMDYVINHSLLDDKDQTTIKQIEKLLYVASELDCKLLVLPLLEESNLEENNIDKFIPILQYLSSQASKYNLSICIESLLKAEALKKCLDLVNRPNVKAVFDTGNRVKESNDLYSEITSLGDYIEHVHIKDKNNNGENVILGTGLVDFRNVFAALKKINYIGPLNFETTRGRDPIETLAFHMNLCNFFTNEVSKDL